MVFAGLLTLAIQLDCGDELSKLPKRSWYETARNFIRRAGSPPSQLGVPSWELMRALDLPPEIDGDVATLASTPELKIFGISSLDHSRLEFIAVYAFSKFPLPVATIFIDSKPTQRPAVHFEFGPEVAYLALQSEPKLISLLQQLGHLKFSPEQLPKITRDLENFIHLERARAAQAGIEIKSLGQIETSLRSIEADRQRGSRPDERIGFGGWLHGDMYAIAIIEDVHWGVKPGRTIYLHPTLASAYHKSWPQILERIKLAGTFRLEWLKLSDPVVIEIESASERRSQYLIFEGGANLPRGLPFFRIDPKTGARISEKPTMLARPIEP